MSALGRHNVSWRLVNAADLQSAEQHEQDIPGSMIAQLHTSCMLSIHNTSRHKFVGRVCSRLRCVRVQGCSTINRVTIILHRACRRMSQHPCHNMLATEEVDGVGTHKLCDQILQ